MKQLASIELKRPTKFHDRCRYFDTGDNSFFCIEISDDRFCHFVYDVLMNVLKSETGEFGYSVQYLKQVYKCQGLKESAVELTFQDGDELTTSSVYFSPEQFEGNQASEILLEEVRMSEIDHV